MPKRKVFRKAAATNNQTPTESTPDMEFADETTVREQIMKRNNSKPQKAFNKKD